ncbi:MAG: protein phosphatase 2C domain-containing protein [Hyphomicrobiales bacterium]
MRLVDAVTQGSGAINEDGWGYVGEADNVEAAWIFDGVTGINGVNILPMGSDARWLVDRAGEHLQHLAAHDEALSLILARLVDGLAHDWRAATSAITIPSDYDPPAACLILVKRYGDIWKGLRLGDSCLLARSSTGDHHVMAASPNNVFDHWLAKEAKARRNRGIFDTQALLAEFRPQMMVSRSKRNQPGGYSILEADRAALNIPEFFDLKDVEAILLNTDGFYRAVDHYDLHSNESLVSACLEPCGVTNVLHALRAVEAADASCEKYPRFKPSDDATAVMLKTGH